MGSEARDGEKLEYTAVVPAEEAARYFERLAAGMRQHAMVLESADRSISLDVSSNVRMEIEVEAGSNKSSIEFEVSWKPEDGDVNTAADMDVIRGSTSTGAYDADAAHVTMDERISTPSGQLPLPDAPGPVEPDPMDLENNPPGEMSDLAVDDVKDREVEGALDEDGEPDDVFAENAEIAFESRAELGQPDTLVTTADGELRDASDVMPDSALAEPLVEGDLSEGEAGIGGAASTPAVADSEIDPATPDVERNERGATTEEGGAPFSEVTPEAWKS